MNTRHWGEITQAVEAYRANPSGEQYDALCRAFADCTLYVPVGDFDGSNAVIALLHSAQGGTFLPLYADKANVRPAQHSEGVRPADWQHILRQLSHVDGCVFEPYSVNFAFDRRFIDTLVAVGATGGGVADGGVADGGVTDGGVTDGGVADGDVVGGVAPEAGSTEEAAPTVHAWPSLDADVPPSIPAQEADSAPSQAPTPTVSIPQSIPSSLNDAMQAVSNECGVPVWLFEVQGGDTQGYLMILDASSQWFDGEGAQAINDVLGRFPDPGAPLDFAPRESEVGRCVDGQAPHYFPRVNTADSDEHGSGFFRRLFKR